MYIYLVENKINGNWYVGKRVYGVNTSDFNRYYGSGVRIKNAIKEFGKKNFSKIVLEECVDKIELADRELFWLKKIISERSLDKCYNILLDCNYIGRNKGFKQTKEHIDKRMESLRKTDAFYWSTERRKKLSDSKKGIPGNDKGKHYIKKSIAKSGGNHPAARRVFNSSTNEYFDTISYAATSLGIKQKTLWQYLVGKRKNKTSMRFA